MAATAVNTWNGIKARHEALRNDPKFKPDKLAPLCAKLDEDGKKDETQKEEKEKAGKIIEDSGGPIEALDKKLAAKYDELKQLTDQIGEIGLEGELTDDNAPRAVSQVAANWGNLARERAEAAKEFAKMSEEQASLMKKSADQFKAKRESIDSAAKKAKADGAKTLEQIKKQVAAYQKIAQGMNNSEMAGDIGSLYSSVSQLYGF